MRYPVAALACFAFIAMASIPCRAALGGNLASVTSDQQVFGATSASAAPAGTTLHTQSQPSGATVRQYVDAAGFVFAVAWEGPVLPDFQRLLGPHFGAYDEAVRLQRRGVRVQTPELVIESGGMMRSFAGRAYLPAKIPAAFSAADIR